MAASANPVGNKPEGSSTTAAAAQKTTGNGTSVNSTSNGSGADCGPTTAALRHNSGISLEWSAEEQTMLEDLLVKYASDSAVVRYAKIAMKMKDKTVRDVALRSRWNTKKESGKRRKEEHSSRKSKERKEKASDSAKSSSHLPNRPTGPSYTPPTIPVDTDDGISYKAIGGIIGELLEQNANMFVQISSNFASVQFRENLELLSKARDNILTILNDHGSLKDAPEIMKQMPPLPVKVNEELANSILPPRRPHQ